MDFGVRSFVAHIERPKYSGPFRKRVDDVISKCRYFILLVTIGTLERPEVLREVKVAYPNGLNDNPRLRVFREDIDDIPRSSCAFLEQTGIDISKENQHDFKTVSRLASCIYILCSNSSFVKMANELSYQNESDTIRSEQRRSDFIPASQKEDIYHQLTEIFAYPFWKYLEYKFFMFRETIGGPWMIQIAFFRLVENKPKILEGKNTKRMQLVHGVVEVEELNGIIDQIVSGQRLSINQLNGSLVLVPGRILTDFFYKSHPMTELFRVSAPSYQLLKPGNNNSELSQIEDVLISELDGEYDNLSDAIHNILELSFWDNSYMPFVTMIASVPIGISAATISENRFSIDINFPQSANTDFAKIMIQKKNSIGRQVGPAQKVSQFNRLNNLMISANADLELNEDINFINIKLYYTGKLLEERYFVKDRKKGLWSER